MTATATLQRSATSEDWAPDLELATVEVDVLPLSPALQLIRAVLVLLFVLTFTLMLQIVVINAAQQSAAQHRLFDGFRAQLARGTAPIGPTDANNKLLPIGTSVAFLEIPSLGVHQIVGEGTSPGALFKGPGHRRDTPLPGQIGTSQVFGRRAGFGGPFADIADLQQGDLIKVSTGQGAFEFHVVDVRFEGDPVPAPPAKGGARLVLTTAAGTPFFPSGVVRVDADLKGTAVVGPDRVISSTNLPAEEKAMAGDARTLGILALWLQALILLSVGAVWAWHRWGRAQAWIVFLPPLMLVGLYATGEAARLLPNLL
jgi:sortase (surface protein transpeptidase)